MPTPAELREAAATGRTVYALRLERGTTKAPARHPIPRVRPIPTARITRDGDRLAIELAVVPRTKKTSQTIAWRTIRGQRSPFIRQSAPARGFAQDVKVAIAPLLVAYKLPLPARRYALSCCFFTDNQNSDTVGLVQALQDALQNAGVVTNDRQFAVIEQACQVYDREHPRIRCTISPADP